MLSRGYPNNGRLTWVIWGYQDVLTTGVGAFSEVGCGRVTEDNLKCIGVYGDLNTDRWQILLYVNLPNIHLLATLFKLRKQNKTDYA